MNSNTGISIQVSLSGYSFRLDGLQDRRSAWLEAGTIFTIPEFRHRYDNVRISLLTPKCTLVPEQFFSPGRIREGLEESVHIDEDDRMEFVRMEKLGAVMLFATGRSESLAKTIAGMVQTTDGYSARIFPELYYMISELGKLSDYNKIIVSYADGYLHLVIAQGNNLMLANSFHAKDFTTVEYFIFLAMKKLQLNPEVSTIFLRTPISMEDEMSLYRYFKDVEKI